MPKPDATRHRMSASTKPSAPPPPHERLELEGPDLLSDRDLLSMLLDAPRDPARSGLSGAASERRATRLLGVFGTLRGLAQATPRELQLLKGTGGGVGREAALRLSAAFALGRRVADRPLRRGALLGSAADIFAHFHERLRGLRKERFLAVLLDGKNRVIREDLISEGCLTSSLVHPREVFAPAIRESANRLVLVHNHPSGDPEPSPEDIDVTARLCAVGDLVGILIADHVIIGDGRYVSLAQRGFLPKTP